MKPEFIHGDTADRHVFVGENTKEYLCALVTQNNDNNINLLVDVAPEYKSEDMRGEERYILIKISVRICLCYCLAKVVY